MIDQWNPKLYDGEHDFVSEYGQVILEMLAPRKGERILDLGCGTGDLANKLALIGVDVVGVDSSLNMIEEAQKKYPKLHFSVEDALALPFEEEFDAVFSNAVLHWIKTPQPALASIYKGLKSGGRFVAEFGGEDNVQRISNSIFEEKAKLGYASDDTHFPWYYPSIGQYTSLMEQAGFQVVFAQHVDRPTRLEGEAGLKNWIDMFTSSFFSNVPKEDLPILLKNIEKSLAEEAFHEDHWIADYKRLRVIGIKK